MIPLSVLLVTFSVVLLKRRKQSIPSPSCVSNLPGEMHCKPWQLTSKRGSDHFAMALLCVYKVLYMIPFFVRDSPHALCCFAVEAKAKHSVSFLHEWVHRWRSNKWVTDGLRRMFMYLDRFYVPNSEDLKTTSEQGMWGISEFLCCPRQCISYAFSVWLCQLFALE